ncbi:BhlA/UviB family holin-like peptide [Terrihalobacillus insolitus]|uniref:BhlA/UviB family holin-like peptide n=1 Tax=Terrihalobacillus insolitus TaxID=2950438 RepID=UPI0023411EB1|nr:BhlA/UviB family holin-like peptide [Terrihalobacillus insolitus]MDC3413951.1 BhlA/UviB family holin-like peptide [Terrihalobacillus insolitus]
MLEMLGGDAILAEAAKQGLWAVLYVTLFVYVLRESKQREERMRQEYHELRQESREREQKLTDFINKISRQFERLATQYEKIAEDVQEIRVELANKQDKVNKEE